MGAPQYNGGSTKWAPARKSGGTWFPFFSQIQMGSEKSSAAPSEPAAGGKELATLLLAMNPNGVKGQVRSRARPVSMSGPAWKKLGSPNYVASEFNGGGSSWKGKGTFDAVFNPTAKTEAAAP